MPPSASTRHSRPVEHQQAPTNESIGGKPVISTNPPALTSAINGPKTAAATCMEDSDIFFGSFSPYFPDFFGLKGKSCILMLNLLIQHHFY
jgi:hypothetical protein